MKVHKRNLAGFQLVPGVQHYAKMTVYVWGYWMCIIKRKEAEK